MITEPVLIRQITASVNKHFDGVKGTYRLYVEGQPIDMANLNAWAEMRVTGPRILKLNKKWLVDLDINIMCSVKKVENIYEPQFMAGSFASYMNKIPVTQSASFEPPNEPIGCFTLRNDVSHQMDVVQWGRVEAAKEISVMATSIEAFLRMELDQ